MLCRAFLVIRRGGIHLIGVPRNVQLQLVPIASVRATYWRQSVVWRQASAPDFPRLLAGRENHPVMREIAHVVICHLPPTQVEAVFNAWKANGSGARVLIAYGGTEENFRNLPGSVTAVWVPDESLRTRDHARERQEYAGVFRAANGWIEDHSPGVTHVHMVEFDVIPLVPDLGERLASVLSDEKADVIGYHALDLSGTIHPHHSHELANVDFLAFLESTSLREVKNRMLNMLGCSTFWTRECFTAMATTGAPRVYLEIGMATLPHHLGYRVRPLPSSQEPFVSFEGDRTPQIEKLRAEGAWMVHPCKQHWQETTPPT